MDASTVASEAIRSSDQNPDHDEDPQLIEIFHLWLKKKEERERREREREILFIDGDCRGVEKNGRREISEERRRRRIEREQQEGL